MRLAGKNAVITGGCGNIGLATARLFLSEGARVMIVDRDAEALEQVRDELGEERLETFAADVTDPASVRAYADHAGEVLGEVHAFFANAGIEGPIKAVRDYPDEGFEAVMAVNCTGVFLGAKYMEPKMPDWSSIVMTSSLMGSRGSPRAIGYAASKHAVVGIMRSAAKDFAARRIRVNTVHPGMVDSAMLGRIEAEMREIGFRDPDSYYTQAIPFGMKVKPAEIAQAVLFLCSDDSRQITGQTLAIDGGWLL